MLYTITPNMPKQDPKIRDKTISDLLLKLKMLKTMIYSARRRYLRQNFLAYVHLVPKGFPKF